MTKSLPKDNKKVSELDSEEFLERVRLRYPEATRKLPYGKISHCYKIDPVDPHHLLPDNEYILHLESVFDFVDDGISFHDANEHLQELTLKSSTKQTVANLYRRHRKPFRTRLRKPKRPAPKQSANSRKISAEKRKITNSLKEIRRVEERMEKKKVSSPSPVKAGAPASTEMSQADLSVFTPNEGPQTNFLRAPEQEVLYGGAAGGGKSWALLVDPVPYFKNKNFRGLLIRRTNDELRELKQLSKELYPAAYPDAKWSQRDSSWTFPSGATLWMTYLERDDDVFRYQGQSFTWVAFDELTQWPTDFAWNYLRSRLRTVDPSLPVFMRGTTNPGGVGHNWVKKTFVDPAAPNTAFWARDLEGAILKYPDNHPDKTKAGRPLFLRKFIPASLYDNPYLLQDGNYEANLMSLPESQRRKLLDGDWDIQEGQAFPEFRKSTHVVEPFEIPNDWRKFRSCDYGYSSNSCVHWFAIRPDGQLIVYRELYVTRMGPKDLAREINTLERDEFIQYGVLDSSVWHKRGEGPSAAEIMINEGCRWRPSDRSKGSRSARFVRLHELLQVDEFTEEPKILFFENCRQIISDLPSLPLHPHGIDDIDDKYPSDHSYDSIGYGIMSRPAPRGPFDGWGAPQSPLNPEPSDRIFGY